MTDVASLCRLYEYNNWANHAVCDALEAAGEPEPGMRLMAHILIAEQVWMERLRGCTITPPDMRPCWSAAHCRELAEMLPRLWQEHLATMTPDCLDEALTYRTTKGDPYVNTRRQVLQHVLLHGMHHRGQIATLLRANGATPPVVDYIAFERG